MPSVPTTAAARLATGPAREPVQREARPLQQAVAHANSLASTREPGQHQRDAPGTRQPAGGGPQEDEEGSDAAHHDPVDAVLLRVGADARSATPSGRGAQRGRLRASRGSPPCGRVDARPRRSPGVVASSGAGGTGGACCTRLGYVRYDTRLLVFDPSGTREQRPQETRTGSRRRRPPAAAQREDHRAQRLSPRRRRGRAPPRRPRVGQGPRGGPVRVRRHDPFAVTAAFRGDGGSNRVGLRSRPAPQEGCAARPARATCRCGPARSTASRSSWSR